MIYFYFYAYGCFAACIAVFHVHAWCQKSVRSPKTGVTDVVSYDGVLDIENGSSCKAASATNH